MTRLPPLSERVALVDKDGMATPYFVRQWQGLSGLPELLLNGRLTIVASDTQLTFSYRGSDGVTRSVDFTLS